MKATKKGGTKHDNGKPKMGLISSVFLVGLAKVLTFGAKKYASHNWRKGLDYSRCYDALQRHLVDFNDGKDYDYDEDCKACQRGDCINHSGEHLLDNAACELMFLREMAQDRKDLDDRYKRGDK